MADLITAFGVWLVEGLGVIVKNFIFLGVLTLLALIVYLKYGKPKPINEGWELFNRQFDAIDERLRFRTPKRIALCPYPHDISDLQKAIYQLHYEPFGEAIGVNAYPILSNPKNLFKLADSGAKEDYEALLSEYKEKFPKDQHWIVFAVKKKMGGTLLFSKVKKALVWVKPSQIIDLNSSDDIIRIRGSGLGHLGNYDYITDEISQITHHQLKGDLTTLIDERTNLRHWDRLGEITGKAMKMDSDSRKEAIRLGLRSFEKQPEAMEAKT